jgi:hypothetical protein
MFLRDVGSNKTLQHHILEDAIRHNNLLANLKSCNKNPVFECLELFDNKPGWPTYRRS